MASEKERALKEFGFGFLVTESWNPVTEKFDSFPSTRRNASVRQLSGRRGELWGAESGTDRLVVVRD